MGTHTDITLALLHSPVVGPATVEPTARVLADRGHTVVVPSLIGVFDVEDVGRLDVLDRLVGQLGHIKGPLVLMAHSGAGPLLGELTLRLPDVVGHIYIDASLPAPGSAWVDEVTFELAARLKSLVNDGRLPPWNEWFNDPDLPTLTDLPLVPWTWFTEPSGPGALPATWAYLSLSDRYPEAISRAIDAEVPMLHLGIQHLATMLYPQEVATAIEQLLGQLRAEHMTEAADYSRGTKVRPSRAS